MVKRELCTGCGACAAVCGESAITMAMDREGFRYPEVAAGLCVHCGRCGKVCPESRVEDIPGRSTFWGARAEGEIRLLGSSGGIFPLMAAQILQDGGVVFGAAMQEDGAVTHMGIDRLENLPLITRTKYVQSDMTQVWEELPRFLKEGRRVLFCGTPCQAAALRTYLGEERCGLILADLICYGVPSPGIWMRYVRYLEKKYRGRFHTFRFRDKRNRNNGHTTIMEIGRNTYTCPLEQDPFCRSYFQNINIRPSCFRCRYTVARRASDITLGDFWGIEEVEPGFDDGMGSSAVICHTEAGQCFWEEIQGGARWFSCREEDVANCRQPRLREPTEPSPRRGRYMALYGWLPFGLWLRLFKGGAGTKLIYKDRKEADRDAGRD